MTCADVASGHDDHGTALHVIGLGAARRHIRLCLGCVASLTAIGLDVRLERRADPVRPDRGRRIDGPIARRIAA